MLSLQFRFFLGLFFLTLLCAMTPAFASFNGPINIGFGLAFVIAAVIALPSGLLCATAELVGVVGVRQRLPLWLGWTALGLSLTGLVIFLGGEKYALKTSIAIVTFLIANIVPLLVYLIPALMSLALVILLPAARWRLIASWSIAITVSWGILFQAQQGTHLGPPGEFACVVLGGATVSMLMWQVAFVIG